MPVRPYRVKARLPVPVLQFSGDNVEEVRTFGTVYVKDVSNVRGTCTTKHGDVTFKVGDYLIAGDGEVYPCTPEEFEKRYEPINVTPNAT